MVAQSDHVRRSFVDFPALTKPDAGDPPGETDGLPQSSAPEIETSAVGWVDSFTLEFGEGLGAAAINRL